MNGISCSYLKEWGKSMCSDIERSLSYQVIKPSTEKCGHYGSILESN